MEKYLKKNDIISNDTTLIQKGVKDDPFIDVYKCNETNVIYLNKINCNRNYYQNISYFQNAIKLNLKKPIKEINYDNVKRLKHLKDILINTKNVLDFGCGEGYFINAVKSKYTNIDIYGVDICKHNLEYCRSKNIECFKELSYFEKNFFDVITIFHVLEHLDNPIETLNKIKKYLKPNGKIIIEVPNGNDILLSKYNLSLIHI